MSTPAVFVEACQSLEIEIPVVTVCTDYVEVKYDGMLDRFDPVDLLGARRVLRGWSDLETAHIVTSSVVANSGPGPVDMIRVFAPLMMSGYEHNWVSHRVVVGASGFHVVTMNRTSPETRWELPAGVVMVEPSWRLNDTGLLQAAYVALDVTNPIDVVIVDLSEDAMNLVFAVPVDAWMSEVIEHICKQSGIVVDRAEIIRLLGGVCCLAPNCAHGVAA